MSKHKFFLSDTGSHCIMCCDRCHDEGHKSTPYRRGYRTKYGCVSCETKLQKEEMRKTDPMAVKRINVDTVEGFLPLCKKKRFEIVGDNRSCFQIFHEEGIRGMVTIVGTYIIRLLFVMLTCLSNGIGIPRRCPYDKRFEKLEEQEDNEEENSDDEDNEEEDK